MGAKAPFWGQLPGHAQVALRRCGWEWFDRQSDGGRQTVLNLYVKLAGMGLWSHVLRPASAMIAADRVGCLDFYCGNVAALRQALTDRWDFRSPEDPVDRPMSVETTAGGSTITRLPIKSTRWDSAEKRATAALHFKQHEGWAQRNMVEVHIDQAGNWLGSKAFWWAGQPVTGIRHLASYDSYKDVFGIRDLLLKQGWDKETLVGIAAVWHCGARDCRTHSAAEHRCHGGVWYCGRTQPQCPGHSNPTHYCTKGTAWHCGAVRCPTHRSPEHKCAAGIWHCGRTRPACPGHSRPDHRCESGAALLFPGRSV